jgi:hypothetical protein
MHAPVTRNGSISIPGFAGYLALPPAGAGPGCCCGPRSSASTRTSVRWPSSTRWTASWCWHPTCSGAMHRASNWATKARPRTGAGLMRRYEPSRWHAPTSHRVAGVARTARSARACRQPGLLHGRPAGLPDRGQDDVDAAVAYYGGGIQNLLALGRGPALPAATALRRDRRQHPPDARCRPCARHCRRPSCTCTPARGTASTAGRARPTTHRVRRWPMAAA